MAIKLVQKRNLSAIRFISQTDDSIDLENSNYDEYLETGLEEHLKFIDGDRFKTHNIQIQLSYITL
jgi:hypothetical protein